MMLENNSALVSADRAITWRINYWRINAFKAKKLTLIWQVFSQIAHCDWLIVIDWLWLADCDWADITRSALHWYSRNIPLILLFSLPNLIVATLHNDCYNWMVLGDHRSISARPTRGKAFWFVGWPGSLRRLQKAFKSHYFEYHHCAYNTVYHWDSNSRCAER